MDPFLTRDAKSVHGIIDQGGATSENNTAYQININIIVDKDIDIEKFKAVIRELETAAPRLIRR